MFKEVIWGIYTECFGFENKVIPPPPPPHPPLLWKVKVTQSCPTLCNPMDCSAPGSSVHRIFQGKKTGVDCLALLQGTFPTQGSNRALLHCKQILYLSEPPWKPRAKHTKLPADSNQHCHTGTCWLHMNPALCLSSWTVASYWSL